MFNSALYRLLNVACGLAHAIARAGMWIFGVYGSLILCMALAAGRAAESVGIYGKPLLFAVGLRLFAGGLRRLARRY